MTRAVYYTATTLDGFIADEEDSLQWLFEQKSEEGGPGGYEEFRAGIGASVMGATTYQWLLDHEPTWEDTMPGWVFTHREFAATSNLTFASGPVSDHLDAISEAAGGKDVWVIGGGDLAGQFADIGQLHRVVVSIAPVTLGAGRPLFPRRHNLSLVKTARNGDFVTATYDVVGARQD